MTRNAWFAGALLAFILHALALTVAAGDTNVIPEIAASQLPREARETLQRIKQGGPFPYERDGIVFGNRERRLPARVHGYYREYTVKTPGARDRGSRRMVAGGCAEGTGKPDAARGVSGRSKQSGSVRRDVAPCSGGEYYYTDDHYGSFRRIRE